MLLKGTNQFDHQEEEGGVRGTASEFKQRDRRNR